MQCSKQYPHSISLSACSTRAGSVRLSWPIALAILRLMIKLNSVGLFSTGMSAELGAAAAPLSIGMARTLPTEITEARTA